MLSGVTSVASSRGLSRKTSFQQCIPFLFTATLGLELLIIIALITFYDSSDRSDNILYICTVTYIILSTIYFAWHSIIKENIFELLAFNLTSTMLNAVALYLTVRHSIITPIKIAFIIFFPLVQLIYYTLTYISYRQFHKYMMHGLDQSISERKLNAVKIFQTLISMLKLEFMLSSILVATFMYYSSKKWSSFKAGAVTIGVIIIVLITIHTVLGILAVTKERLKIVISYFIGVVIVLAIKAFMLAVITIQPGDSLSQLLVNQCYVIMIGDLIVQAGIVFMGLKIYRSFGIGAMSIIRHTNDDHINEMFI